MRMMTAEWPASGTDRVRQFAEEVGDRKRTDCRGDKKETRSMRKTRLMSLPSHAL